MEKPEVTHPPQEICLHGGLVATLVSGIEDPPWRASSGCRRAQELSGIANRIPKSLSYTRVGHKAPETETRVREGILSAMSAPGPPPSSQSTSGDPRPRTKSWVTASRLEGPARPHDGGPQGPLVPPTGRITTRLNYNFIWAGE